MKHILQSKFEKDFEEIVSNLKEPIGIVGEGESEGHDLVMMPIDDYLDMLKVLNPAEYKRVKDFLNISSILND